MSLQWLNAVFNVRSYVRNFSIKTWIIIKIKIKTRHLVFIVHLRFKFFYSKFFHFFCMVFCDSKVSKWNVLSTNTRSIALTMERNTIRAQQNHHQVTKVKLKALCVCGVNREKRKKFIHNNPLLVVGCWLWLDHLTEQLNQSFGRALSTLYKKKNAQWQSTGIK